MNDVGEGTFAWIGAIRVGPTPSQNNQFTWIDGTPMGYSNWSQYQPTNHKGIEFCVHFYGHGQWNDYDCHSVSVKKLKIMDFVCEIPI